MYTMCLLTVMVIGVMINVVALTAQLIDINGRYTDVVSGCFTNSIDKK